MSSWGTLGDWKIQMFPATKDDTGFCAVYVPKSMSPDDVYTVIIEDEGKPTCDCPDLTYRGHDEFGRRNNHSCKHLRAVTAKILELKS